MNRWRFGILAAALFGSVCLADKMEGQRNAPPDRAQMLMALERASAPKAQHQALAGFVGQYTYTGELAMGVGEPVRIRGECKGVSIIGNRYVELTATSSAGEPPTIESRSVLGYDSRKDKYTFWGVDSLGTGSVTAEGAYDAATRTFTLYGVDVEGDRQTRYRFVFRLEDSGYRMMVEFEGAPDQWSKAIETVYTRTS